MHEIHLNTVDSTNAYAKQHASSFPPDQITCITAEEQTAGRGRFQRTWISPPHTNLYITFSFHLPPTTLHLISIGQILAFSFATLLLNENLHPKIKWPNDVQLNDKKVSGILCELQLPAVFLGIGINVNMTPSGLAKIDQPATSLLAATGKPWDRKILLQKLQKQFSLDLEKFKKEGFAPFHGPVENLLAYKGETIRCFDGAKEWVGICHSLTNDGQLNLLLPNRKLHTVTSGMTTKEG